MSEPEQPMPIELGDLDPARLAACRDACFECATACTRCADACVDEGPADALAGCIRANLDCADICESTGRLLWRPAGTSSNLVRAFLDTCAEACATCADECAGHAELHPHCSACAEACRRCERECRALSASLGS